MPAVNYLRVFDHEYVAANRNVSYWKGFRSGKKKLMKAYIYTNKMGMNLQN